MIITSQKLQEQKTAILQIKASLTHQQTKVVLLFLCGLSTAEVAIALGRSIRTCRVHLLAVRKKWNIKSDYGLAIAAMKKGYCEIPEIDLNLVNQRKLTPKETHVLKYIALDFNAAEVSTRMGISRRTVEGHIVSIREKWNVDHGVSLIIEAFKRNYLQLPAQESLNELKSVPPFIRSIYKKQYMLVNEE